MTRHAATTTPQAPRREAPAERLWSIRDLATYLSCSRRAVERLRSAGKLPRPALHVGRMPRWFPQSVRLWAEGGGAR
jgi:hypothetical protein